MKHTEASRDYTGDAKETTHRSSCGQRHGVCRKAVHCCAESHERCNWPGTGQNAYCLVGTNVGEPLTEE
jgi:hypothetical protein